MASEQLEDAVLVSLPWTPTMSEFEALKDAIPKMDAEFDARKKAEQVEAAMKKMAEESEGKMNEMRQAFETALKRTNDFLVVTTNHVGELENRLKEQERYECCETDEARC